MFPLNGLAPRSPATGPLETNEVSAPPSLQSRLQEINLKIIAPTGQIEGPGGEIRIQLENPTIGPEDIPLNEFVQQLESLAEVPMPVFALGQGLHELSEGSQAFAEMVLSSRASGQPENPEEIAAMGNQFAQQAELIEVNIRALIENSTYPNFSDFLKELVKVAQDLRESATKAKMAAINSSYSTMYSAAEQMKTAAVEAKASRDEQIAADKKEAIGQICAGIASAIIAGGFAIGGAGQLGATLGSAASSIITGSVGVNAASDKYDSSESQYYSDLANVAKQRLDAAVKLIEAQSAIADDLKEIALSLRDMVLKLMQDFISSQNSIVQRANV
jgi:Arc/MetJ-type ribon-helix-helix transcriptional regulator